MKDVKILAIETSCDETSVAIVKNGREVISNIISSQIDMHKRFGGVVPEVASRMHLEAINNIVDEALRQGNMTLEGIDDEELQDAIEVYEELKEERKDYGFERDEKTISG